MSVLPEAVFLLSTVATAATCFPGPSGITLVGKWNVAVTLSQTKWPLTNTVTFSHIVTNEWAPNADCFYSSEDVYQSEQCFQFRFHELKPNKSTDLFPFLHLQQRWSLLLSITSIITTEKIGRRTIFFTFLGKRRKHCSRVIAWKHKTQCGRPLTDKQYEQTAKKTPANVHPHGLLSKHTLTGRH